MSYLKQKSLGELYKLQSEFEDLAKMARIYGGAIKVKKNFLTTRKLEKLINNITIEIESRSK